MIFLQSQILRLEDIKKLKAAPGSSASSKFSDIPEPPKNAPLSSDDDEEEEEEESKAAAKTAKKPPQVKNQTCYIKSESLLSLSLSLVWVT